MLEILTKIESNELKRKIEELNQMILTGKQMDAFEKYYHEDVVMRKTLIHLRLENLKSKELQAMQMIEAFHGAEVKSVAVGDNVTTSEWEMDVTYKGASRMKMCQVAVQKGKMGILTNVFIFKLINNLK
ncbi:MAG: nuclear transport factor 2 family protein [Sphingobacteriaceae bacterium]|nr:nuclear transport factor 2 family protein [Sphingobacteriaceae bacterium]